MLHHKFSDARLVQSSCSMIGYRVAANTRTLSATTPSSASDRRGIYIQKALIQSTLLLASLFHSPLLVQFLVAVLRQELWRHLILAINAVQRWACHRFVVVRFFGVGDEQIGGHLVIALVVVLLSCS